MGEVEFKKNVGQERVLKLFQTPAREFLLSSGSRCFAGGTLVQTDNGHTPIENIKVGDMVLSTNNSTNIGEYKEVLETFRNSMEQLKQMVIFEFKDGSTINCTTKHELRKEKTFTPAIDIAKRAMERGIWDKRHLSSEQFGSSKDVQLERHERRSGNESRKGHERIFEDDGKEGGREVSYSQDASSSLSSVYSQSREQGRGQSHQQRQGGQPIGELGVGYKEREQRAHDEARSSNGEQWLKERDGNDDRGASEEYKERIQQGERVDDKAVVGTLRGEVLCTSRHSSGQVVEAREVRLDDIISITFYSAKIETFDLCVKDNHNYTVTENNIIVHNSGKTFIIIYAMIVIASRFAGSRHLIARKHFSHVKGSVWLDTLPKVIDLCFPQLKPHIKWNNTDFYIEFPNGSSIFLAGLDDKERVDKILGREYLTIFLNEISEISYDVYTTVKSRLAQKCSYVNADGELILAKNMMFADQNPTTNRHFSKILFIDKREPESNTPVKNPERYVHTFIHPQENEENLSEDYLEMLEGLPPAKRRRFLDGQYADDSMYALWSQDGINKNRVDEAPNLKRIVVAIDPAITATDASDETGIIVKGLGFDDHIYTLQDLTGTYSPTEWASVAISAYHEWQADKIVAEVNQGGDMVETILRSIDVNIPYEGVWATRNKYARAEPVSALTEQGKDHHVGIFPDLENEQTQWEGKKGEKSPNRIDALVWATFALLPEMQGKGKRKLSTFGQLMAGQQ